MIVEDERPIRRRLTETLSEYGEVFESSTKDEAFGLLNTQDFDLAIIDLNLHGKVEGFHVLEETKKRQIYSVVLSTSDKEEYYKKAILEYHAEGFYDKRDFIRSIDLIMKEYFLKQTFSNHDLFTDKFITQDTNLIESIRSVIKSQALGNAVLILGESGVGKTALAKVLHEAGGFKGEFVHVNAAAIPENLIESTLFGHKKGAFTGADTNKKGLLAKANGGTLFIDEISSIPMNLQAKLLTCLDEKKFIPVGGEEDEEQYSNFNLVTATYENIVKKIADKKFRSDLYNRIAQETLTISPLRNRPDDIPLIVKHLLKLSPKKKIILPEAMEFLKSLKWADNTRGLIGIVKYSLSLKEGVISKELIEKRLISIEGEIGVKEEKRDVSDEAFHIDLDYIEEYGLNQFINDTKVEIVKRTLKKARGNHKEAQRILGISRTQFFHYLKVLKEER